jgi:hypothetical protein
LELTIRELREKALLERTLVSIFINPAAIASGAKVSIGVEGMSGDHGMFEDQVIKDGAPLTCHPIDASR